jgi:hypothetical protein
MNRSSLIMRYAGLMLAATVTLGAMLPATAQDGYTADDAIALAASSPAFADGLANAGNYTAVAYYTGNAYHIWRVEFLDSSGERLGFANVSLEHGRVFDYEEYFSATDLQISRAEDIVRDVIANDDDIQLLLGDFWAYDSYVGWEDWANGWGVWIENGTDSLWLLVQFDGNSPENFENGRILRIVFQNVLEYDEWYAGMEQGAIGIAYLQGEIGEAVRGSENWDASAQPVGDERWTVTFSSDGETLAIATVDMNSRTVIDFVI